MYYPWNYSKYCWKRVTLKINMCLSRAAHHKLSLRHGYCFGKQLRSITTIPVCINFRLYYVSKNAESQFSIIQLLNIFFQSFRNVNVCTDNNIFLIFLWYYSFLIFYILRTLIHKNQNIIWGIASFHAQIRYVSGISCPMSSDHLQNNIWLFVGDQNMTPKLLCTKYCILSIKQ